MWPKSLPGGGLFIFAHCHQPPWHMSNLHFKTIKNIVSTILSQIVVTFLGLPAGFMLVAFIYGIIGSLESPDKAMSIADIVNPGGLIAALIVGRFQSEKAFFHAAQHCPYYT